MRVVTAEREHLIRQSLSTLQPQQIWKVHRGTLVQARCIASARREESGKVTLVLRGRAGNTHRQPLVRAPLQGHLRPVRPASGVGAAAYNSVSAPNWGCRLPR